MDFIQKEGNAKRRQRCHPPLNRGNAYILRYACKESLLIVEGFYLLTWAFQCAHFLLFPL